MHPGTSARFVVALLAASTTACMPGLFTPVTTIQTPRGTEKAVLGGADEFPRFPMPDHGTKLADVARSDDDVELAILERDGEARAVVVSDLTYHHVAEGTLGGRPIAVAYCVVCDSAVAFTPVVDGRVLHVSAGGLSNGVVLLRDDETGTYWNIFTGEGLAGPLAGRTMATLPVARMSVAEARATRPELELVRADTSAFGRLWTRAVESYARTTEGYMPSSFLRSFDHHDPRRDDMELGLGVVTGGCARFYPARELAKLGAPFVDRVGGTAVRVDHDARGLGRAAPADAAAAPFVVWGRWYGFAASFPGCDVWSAESLASGASAPSASDAIAGLRAPCADR